MQVLEQLRLPKEAAELTDENVARAAQLSGFVPAGHALGTVEVLFKEIREESVIEALKERQE